jgi:hypothetical protein
VVSETSNWVYCPPAPCVGDDEGKPHVWTDVTGVRWTCEGKPQLTILDEAKRFLDGRVALGKATYGMTLDENDAEIDARLLHLQEELADGLQYVIWVRRKLRESNVTSANSWMTQQHIDVDLTEGRLEARQRSVDLLASALVEEKERADKAEDELRKLKEGNRG